MNKEPVNIENFDIDGFEKEPGRHYVIAPKYLVEYGLKVLAMYRVEPKNSYDSGWRFFSGALDELSLEKTQKDIYDAFDASQITHIEENKEIEKYLDYPVGCGLERQEDDTFVLVKGQEILENTVIFQSNDTTKIEELANILYDQGSVSGRKIKASREDFISMMVESAKNKPQLIYEEILMTLKDAIHENELAKKAVEEAENEAIRVKEEAKRKRKEDIKMEIIIILFLVGYFFFMLLMGNQADKSRKEQERKQVELLESGLSLSETILTDHNDDF